MIPQDAFVPWTFKGLVSSQTEPNANMLSYTAQSIVCLKANSEPGVTDLRVIQFLMGIRRCEVVPGLYSRYPDRVESTSIDDFLSLASCDANLAKEIFTYGSQTWGNFDALQPGKKGFGAQWLYRFPGLKAHFQYGFQSRPSAFQRTLWALSVWWAAGRPSTQQDGWMQASLMILTYEASGQRTWLCDQAVKHWKLKAPRSIGRLFAEYSGFPEHPLALYWPEV